MMVTLYSADGILSRDSNSSRFKDDHIIESFKRNMRIVKTVLFYLQKSFFLFYSDNYFRLFFRQKETALEKVFF